MPRVVIVTASRLYGEGLARALAPSLEVAGALSRPSVMEIARLRPEIVLTDGRELVVLLPRTKVIVIGLSGDTDEILALLREGVAGYVTDTASLDELVETVLRAADGELTCSPAVAAGMARQLSRQTLDGARAIGRLTERELEVVRLFDEGLSNKEIALRLRIDHRTVKNHARNVYAKLSVRGRGEAAAVARRAGLIGRGD